jgi:hypothetical protein
VLGPVMLAASDAEWRRKQVLLHVVTHRSPGHAPEFREVADSVTDCIGHATEYSQLTVALSTVSFLSESDDPTISEAVRTIQRSRVTVSEAA